MGLVERVKNICLTPNTEWPVIAGESGTSNKLMTDYVAPLALIGPVAGLIGGWLVGYSTPTGIHRIPFLAGLGIAGFTFAMTFASIFIMSLIIDALAPQFGGEKNPQQALKVAVYAYTPALAGAVFQVLPALIMLAGLAAFYGLYLLYLGLPRLMKCPEDRAISYMAVVAFCAIVLAMIVSTIANTFTGPGPTGAGMPGAQRDGRSGMQDAQK
jgi:hypothetical protein